MIGFKTVMEIALSVRLYKNKHGVSPGIRSLSKVHSNLSISDIKYALGISRIFGLTCQKRRHWELTELGEIMFQVVHNKQLGIC